MKARLDTGTVLDAEFDLAFEAEAIRITLHARGGAKKYRNPTNPHYNQALQLLLERLKVMDATLEEVRLASRTVENLPPHQRKLAIVGFSLPVRVTRVRDLRELRYAIRRAACNAHSTASDRTHGNATKRMELIATSTLDVSTVVRILEWGETPAISISGDVLDPSSDQAFPEGALVQRTHLERERNRTLVSRAKAKFKKAHGCLFCEVCGFNFRQAYGPVGSDFIEAHHEKPLSDALKVLTHIDDLRMVCANCHRILHLQRPWLTTKELRDHLSAIMSFEPKRATLESGLVP